MDRPSYTAGDEVWIGLGANLYQGGKAYGADLGPFKTPAREDDPRLMGPNFYYDQEDFLKERQSGRPWHYTVLRPEAVSGFAVGNPMNLIMVIGVYAAISKELGLPLRFPGPEAAYRALYQMTSAHILAKATGSSCGPRLLMLSKWRLRSQYQCQCEFTWLTKALSGNG
jgi:hypothetical protein